MENNKTQQPQQDVVKLLREIRDEISIEIANMTYEEERAFLNTFVEDKSNKQISCMKVKI